MIPQILVIAQTIAPPRASAPGRVLPCIIVLVGICFWGLVIFGIVQLIRFLGSARKEQKLIRMELGKLSDEVGQIRQELKGQDESLAKEDGND